MLHQKDGYEKPSFSFHRRNYGRTKAKEEPVQNRRACLYRVRRGADHRLCVDQHPVHRAVYAAATRGVSLLRAARRALRDARGRRVSAARRDRRSGLCGRKRRISDVDRSDRWVPLGNAVDRRAVLDRRKAFRTQAVGRDRGAAFRASSLLSVRDGVVFRTERRTRIFRVADDLCRAVYSAGPCEARAVADPRDPASEAAFAVREILRRLRLLRMTGRGE